MWRKWQREREREMVAAAAAAAAVAAALPGVEKMEGQQVGHVAVDLDGGGLGSCDGLQVVKVNSENFPDGNVMEKDHVFLSHFESADAGVAATL